LRAIETTLPPPSIPERPGAFPEQADGLESGRGVELLPEQGAPSVNQIESSPLRKEPFPRGTRAPCSAPPVAVDPGGDQAVHPPRTERDPATSHGRTAAPRFRGIQGCDQIRDKVNRWGRREYRPRDFPEVLR